MSIATTAIFQHRKQHHCNPHRIRKRTKVRFRFQSRDPNPCKIKSTSRAVLNLESAMNIHVALESYSATEDVHPVLDRHE
ncbi:unnamed protein product [Urochloa humidicola]